MPTIAWIRWWLGNLPEGSISDDDIQLTLDFTEAQHPAATDCQYNYYTLVNILEWLIRNDASSSSTTSGAAGDITKRIEERGRTKITEEYSESSSTSEASDWGSILEDLKEDPDSVGCTVFATSTTSSGSIIFGGLGNGNFNTSTPWRQPAASTNFRR